MAETDYVSVPELRDFLRMKSTDHDVDLGNAISAASRQIETWTDRGSFLDASADTATARTYASRRGDRITIDDVIDDGDFVVKVDFDLDGVFEETWTAGTEFSSMPINHAADGFPISSLETRRGHLFPTVHGSHPVVQVTGKHGWPSVPVEIEQATKILAGRLYRRAFSPEGVVQGFDAPVRVSSRMDPDVESLLVRFRLHPIKL